MNSFGSSSMDPLGPLVGGLSILGGLFVFCLVIAGVVFCYIKFLGVHASRDSRGAKFFNFDHLYVDKILKTFYLIFVILFALGALSLPFMFSSAFGIGGFIIGLLLGVLFFAFGQLMLRVTYEFQLITVRMANDLRAIRHVVAGKPGEEPANGFEKGDMNPSKISAAAAIAKNTTLHTQGASNADAWECQCGAINTKGMFCAKCGSHRPE